MPKTHKVKTKKRLSGVKKGIARKELLKLEKQIKRKVAALEDLDDMMESLGHNPRTRGIEVDEKIMDAVEFAMRGATTPYDDTLSRARQKIKKEFKKQLKAEELREAKRKRNAILKKLKQSYQ